MSSRDIISVYTALPVARASRHHQGPGRGELGDVGGAY